MSIHLRMLVWEKRDTCRAHFEVSGSGERIESVFHVVEGDPTVIHTPDPNVFDRMDIDATEIQMVVSAVIHFCRAAQAVPSQRDREQNRFKR